MQIKEYLFYYNMTKKQFSELVGVHRQTVENITNGRHRSVRPDICRKIVEGTQGKVSYEDLLNELSGIRPVHPDDKENSSQQIKN